jgi:hypothetical protein
MGNIKVVTVRSEVKTMFYLQKTTALEIARYVTV